MTTPTKQKEIQNIIPKYLGREFAVKLNLNEHKCIPDAVVDSV
jgi:hypothetical protein